MLAIVSERRRGNAMSAGMKKFIFVSGFCVCLGIAWFIVDKVDGKKIGDVCEYQTDCSGSGECLESARGRYCSMRCAAAAECPQGWRCAAVASETYSGKTGEKTAETSVMMCLRP
jgi:hypothetical protein